MFPAPLRGTLLALLGVVWIGLLVQTVAGFDADRGVSFQIAIALKLHGLFLLGVALLWGASETRHLSTGLRVGALVVGAFFVAQTALHTLFSDLIHLEWLF